MAQAIKREKERERERERKRISFEMKTMNQLTYGRVRALNRSCPAESTHTYEKTQRHKTLTK
jgi:hypothetical protein